MRKFFIGLVCLVLLLILLDRAGAYVAEREISTRVQSASGLPARPHVTVRGIPFLTQLASGHYQEIDVSIASATAGGVQLRNVDARFTGVHASLSLLLGQNSGSVTADSATGTALIPYAQIQRRLPGGIKIAPAGSSLRVTGSTPLGAVRGTARLAVTSAGISVSPQNITVGGVSAGSLAARFSFTIGVGALPLHLSLTGVHVASGGLLLDAAAHNVTFASG